MTQTEFKSLCRDEFGISQFSNPETFAPMKEAFSISGRTFVHWCYRGKPQKYFERMVELYFENKRLKSENSKLSESLVSLSERVENLKPNL